MGSRDPAGEMPRSRASRGAAGPERRTVRQPDTPATTTEATNPVAALDVRLMTRALELASTAGAAGEVPVGAVVAAPDGTILGEGFNGPIHRHDPTAHAEIEALRAASQAIGNYRLTGATLVSTVEPCLMCLGAALHARIGRLVFGAGDPKVGSTHRLEQLRQSAVFNHRFEVRGGVLESQCASLLKTFFVSKRHGEVPKWS